MQMAMEKIRIPNIDLPHPNHLEWQEIIDDDQHALRWNSVVRRCERGGYGFQVR